MTESLLPGPHPAGEIRRSSSHLLFVPRVEINIGTRVFSVAAPQLVGTHSALALGQQEI